MNDLWIMYDPEDGVNFFDSEVEAVQAANERIDVYLQDEWDEGVEGIVVACVTHTAVQINRIDKSDYTEDEWDKITGGNDGWDYYCDYEILPLRLMEKT